MSRRRQPDRLPCPCGCDRAPIPVADRTVRKARMWRVRCPLCKLTTPNSRPDLINVAWNQAVRSELERRQRELVR